jgi:parallel beta-helix repeat protein
MATQLTTILALGILLGLGFQSGALAQNCGDIVTGEVTLTSDLTCPTGHGLFVGSGATLDCNGHNITGGDDAEQYGIYLRNVSDATVRNCTIQHFEVGFRIVAGNSITLQNNLSQLNTRYGVEVTQESTGALIQGNTIYSNSDEGIHLSGPTSSDAAHQLVGNTLTGNSAEGIYLYYSNASTITGNTIENQGAAGIYMKGASRNTLTANSLVNNPFQLVAGSQFNVLTSNSIVGDRLKFDGSSNNQVFSHSVQSQGGRPSAAYDFNNASNNTIVDSEATRPADYHIRAANSSTNNVFTSFSWVPQKLKCYIDSGSSVSVTNSNGKVLQCSSKN